MHKTKGKAFRRLPTVTARQAFEAIEHALLPVLSRNDFQLSASSLDEKSFGSAFVIYQNDRASIRLTWDGKQEWIVLESAPAGWKEPHGWIDVLLQYFRPPENGPKAVDEIANDLRRALIGHLSTD